MSDPKSLQRLLAVQALYQISINELSNENSIKSILEDAMHQPGLEELKKKPNFNYAEKIINGYLENVSQIDLLIRTSLTSTRSFDKLDNLIHAILQMAVYEIKFGPMVPKKIIINEYLNICHIFFTGKESKLVNGVLDSL
ncbi:MAG: transcription antitermination factor NusB [Candidatus Pelagibacterales bacterium]|jgi:N utilization substance protein B|tara:strand:- start:666 stop:1085 length:420 start_codon:yes stop_codon:yes gene_type:complete